jgi:hypothetical protein
MTDATPFGEPVPAFVGRLMRDLAPMIPVSTVLRDFAIRTAETWARENPDAARIILDKISSDMEAWRRAQEKK